MSSLREDLDRTISAAADAVAEATQALVRFETVSVDLLSDPDPDVSDEAALQVWVAERLERSGFEVDQWEPDANELSSPLIPSWHHWRGRPITVGVKRGSGRGRSLIINGHVDVVAPGEAERWASPPFAAELRDGRIYGRGAVDMKGGIAAALIAVEALSTHGVELGGDLIFQAVTDEEIGGMGTIAAAERGYRADAALIPEPSGLDLWVTTRGIIHARLGIEGRSAHAEMNQPHWRDGGGVNAAHKAVRISRELIALGESWSRDPERTHPLVSPPGLHVTSIHGGSYIANIPESCELLVNATYAPSQGGGDEVRIEMEQAVGRACEGDDWLQEHPPSWTWMLDYPSSEIDAGAHIVTAAQAAARRVGGGGELVGLDSGFDGALLSTIYGIPSPAFGPGDLRRAHATDEWVGVSELVDAARAYAQVIVDWCGVG